MKDVKPSWGSAQLTLREGSAESSFTWSRCPRREALKNCSSAERDIQGEKEGRRKEEKEEKEEEKEEEEDENKDKDEDEDEDENEDKDKDKDEKDENY